MKKISYFISLILSFLFMASLTACNDIPVTDVLIPEEETELIVYEVPIDTNYTVLLQENYNTFEVPIYTNKSLNLSDIKLLSTDLEAQGISIAVSDLNSVDISVDSDVIDFIENKIELKASHNNDFGDLNVVNLNKLNLSLNNIKYSLDVKVAIYNREISSIYPDSIFEVGDTCNITNKNGKDRVLLFAGNLTADMLLNGYELVGGEWLSIAKSQWYGSKNNLIYEIDGELTETKEISANLFKSLSSYFTLSYTKVATQWYSDYICMSINKFNGIGNEKIYKLAYKVVNLSSESEMSAYYAKINEIIKKQK